MKATTSKNGPTFALAGLAILAASLCACGKGDTGNADAGSDAGSDAGCVNCNSDAGSSDAGSDAGSCLGADLLGSIGQTRVLTGASMSDTSAAAGHFDVRYLYLAGQVPDGSGPCSSCLSACATNGTSCVGGACGWWGCWQWDQVAPGDYIRHHIKISKDHAQIPMVTYYLIFQSSGVHEGSLEVTQASNDAVFMPRYYADYRFFLQQVDKERAFIHLEPDFWGYGNQVNSDPTLVPAKVASANTTDCSGQPNTYAGLARCMIAMARKYAPNAKVGLHGSAWGTGIDATNSNDASLDLAAEGHKLGTYLLKLGADTGDFIAVDASDRDSGYYETQGRNTWWDATNATAPNFHRAFAWAKSMAETVGKPIVWWQVPVGNSSQDNTPHHYKDNRVDYFFAHTDELAAAHSVGMFFGAGDGNGTTPETDGNNLISKVNAYYTAGGTQYCH